MNTDLISEENYIHTMKREVEPWLDDRRTVLWENRGVGQSIYCERYLADDPRGVVFISHGFKESATKYAESVWYFLHEGYHVYIMEHCGHGRSYRLVDDLSLVHVDDYSRYIDDLLATAHTARRDVDMYSGGSALPMYLYGHSMGGGIGIAAAAREPDLFDRIVLSSPMIRPLTGHYPYRVTAIGCAFLCRIGRSENYCPGFHPYEGPEDFETSASLSRPRFDYYQEIKAANRLFQLSAASIGWAHAAVRLDSEIMRHSVGEALAPMLIFQAWNDGSVSLEAQDRFVRERNEKYPGSVTLKKLPGTKHEIYNSPDDAVKPFWDELFDFLSV